MIRLPIRTTNPLNGSQGNSMIARMMRGRDRRHQRETTQLVFGAWWRVTSHRAVVPPWRITLTRVAPSSGLDDDALPASCKAIRDGIADVLGTPNDRDPIYEWRYAQRRGKPREYAVEVTIETREAAHVEVGRGAGGGSNRWRLRSRARAILMRRTRKPREEARQKVRMRRIGTRTICSRIPRELGQRMSDALRTGRNHKGK